MTLIVVTIVVTDPARRALGSVAIRVVRALLDLDSTNAVNRFTTPGCVTYSLADP